MAKATKKQTSKALTQQKQRRRQWVTFWRMCRYGINNFTRNAWLTVAATAVMAITLFVILAGVASQNILRDTIAQLRDSVTMAIYVKTDTPPEAVTAIQRELSELSSVVSVSFLSPEEARTALVQDQKDNLDVLEAVKEADNALPGTFNIKVNDINDTEQLKNFVASNETVKSHLDRSPSFAGERRESLEKIGEAATFAQQLGIGASIILVTISMLIIFNTIRMAIFNRREEIQMMKLIGAEKSFIRGPFLVEAIVYGFFAALIASGLGFAALYFAAPSLAGYAINVQPTLDAALFYGGFVLLGMILIGAIIGTISSLLATRRYLKL